MQEESNSNTYYIKASAWTYTGVVLTDVFLEGYRYSNFFVVILIGVIFSILSAKFFYFIFGYYLRRNFKLKNIAKDIDKIHALRKEIRNYQIITVAIISIITVSNLK